MHVYIYIYTTYLMFKVFKVIVDVTILHFYVERIPGIRGRQSRPDSLAEVMAAYGLLNSDEGAGNFHSGGHGEWNLAGSKQT